MGKRYRVLETFRDRRLNREIKEGTLYPPEGITVPDSWIEKLRTEDNKCARVFIEEIKDNAENMPEKTAKKNREIHDGNAKAKGSSKGAMAPKTPEE